MSEYQELPLECPRHGAPILRIPMGGGKDDMTKCQQCLDEQGSFIAAIINQQERQSASLISRLEMLRQHHADQDEGMEDDFDFDAAIVIKQAIDEIKRLRGEVG